MLQSSSDTYNIPSSSNGLSRASRPVITDLSMSMGNDCLCTNFTILFSASVTSDTDKGVGLSFNSIFELVFRSARDFGRVILCKTQIIHAANLRSRSHLQLKQGTPIIFCTTAAPTIIFALLTHSSLSRSASEASLDCGAIRLRSSIRILLHFPTFLVSWSLRL